MAFSLRKHPFLLALRRWGRFSRNVPIGEERGETDVFAGHMALNFLRLVAVIWNDCVRVLDNFKQLKKD